MRLVGGFAGVIAREPALFTAVVVAVADAAVALGLAPRVAAAVIGVLTLLGGAATRAVVSPALRDL